MPHSMKIGSRCQLFTACLRWLSAGLQERVEELKQVMAEDKSTKDMLKARQPACFVPALTFLHAYPSVPAIICHLSHSSYDGHLNLAQALQALALRAHVAAHGQSL